MTKQIMEQALEALGKLVKRAAPYGEQDWLDGKAAIEVLRTALAQQGEQQPAALQVNGVPPFRSPPNDVIAAALLVSDWARRNNWKNWRIGNCCSEDYTAPAARRKNN